MLIPCTLGKTLLSLGLAFSRVNEEYVGGFQQVLRGLKQDATQPSLSLLPVAQEESFMSTFSSSQSVSQVWRRLTNQPYPPCCGYSSRASFSPPLGSFFSSFFPSFTKVPHCGTRVPL